MLRVIPANAELRRLRGDEPRLLEFLRPGEPLGSAANWRWLVILDARGVHVLDWLAAAGCPKARYEYEGEAPTEAEIEATPRALNVVGSYNQPNPDF